MTSKKWIISFILTATGLTIALMLFNFILDPFGVFGDHVFEWYSYDATNNPRTAKITYLDKHHDKYDSYIVGSSSTSSYPVDALNEYFDASFYNMIVYGADMLDTCQISEYLINNYTVKNLVLNVFIENGMTYGVESNPYTHSMPSKLDGTSNFMFYNRFLLANPAYGAAKVKAMLSDKWLSEPFDVFDEETGAYDKRKRDVEYIGDMESYLKAYPVFADYPTGKYSLSMTDKCMESVKKIVEICEENGVNLTVVTSPIYSDYMKFFDPNEVLYFYKSLAEVTDFWDFSYSSVSYEPRFFYDSTHFRNNVGYMALARIFGDDDVYTPDDFGKHVTASSAETYFETYFDVSVPEADSYTADVPILMYHNIDEMESSGETISAAAFEEQISALVENGYTGITFEDLISYVDHGTALPEKPVIITFDDGYLSNYEYAFPILKKYNMCATIFVIGYSFGCDTYKETGEKIYPHFGAAEAKEMCESGLISIQSHTYDMHQSSLYEDGEARETVAPFSGEKEADYINALRDDIGRSISQIEGATGEKVFALAYPQGYYNEVAQAVFVDEGIRVTLTTEPGVSTVICGLRQSLTGMRRFPMGENVTREKLIEMIQK